MPAGRQQSQRGGFPLRVNPVQDGAAFLKILRILLILSKFHFWVNAMEQAQARHR